MKFAICDHKHAPGFTKLALVGSVLTLAAALPSLGTPPPNGVAPVIVPAGGFAIDGDLFARQPGAASGDWVVATNLPGTGEGILAPDGTPLNPLTTFHFIDPYNNSSTDLIFSGGSKWEDDPNTWGWTTGKPSSKTDINNVLLHLAADVDGHTWAVISADRASTVGDSYIDFELLQNPLVRKSNGNFESSGPDGGRTVNDMVLSLAFTGGGKVADFFAWRWESDGNGGFHYVDVTSALPTGRVFVALNTNNVAVPYSAFGGMAYTPNAFAEAAIDLTALLGGFDPCESFGFETIMVKTKASASDSAGIEDFIDPIAYKLRIGPAADAGPDQIRCADSKPTAFPLNGTASAGLTSVASSHWTVVSGTATVDDPSALVTTARVSSATATLRLEVVQANGCSDLDEITLTAVEPPALTITGDASLCPDSTAEYSAPPGMDRYQWAISGNGSILGPSDEQNVLVLSSNACGEPFELTLTASSNVCTVATIADVLVGDTVPPILTIPGNVVLETPADTGTNATGVATALDDCGAVTVHYTDLETNLCGSTRVISREWVAMDSCGNITSATQTITVQDTTPPVLSIPPNVTLECPADTTTASTGVATALDNGGTPVVSHSDVVTAGCGDSRTIARTWMAVDACGNASSGVQTIVVQDTTPPVLSVPPNVTLECPADTTTSSTGVASAQDNCGTPTVTHSDVVTAGCGDSKTIARTWMAVDECGNSSSGVQTIIVQDTTPPVLSIPPNVTLECPANTDTSNTGVASAQDNCGTPTVTHSDAVTAGCGDSRTIARTWTAVDECGNASSGVQTIIVQDTTPPVLSVPPDVTLECPADTTTASTGVATALDNGGTPVVTHSDVVTAGCGDSRTIARTWMAVDECGNASSGVQTIIVQDTAPPVLSIPPNVTLECPADTTTASTGVASAQDNCGTPTVTHSDVVTAGCGDSRTIARTWMAVDECGNSSSGVQTIIVQDTTPPVLDDPPDVTVECGQSTDPDDTGWPQAQDSCGTVTLTYTETQTPGCGGSKLIGRTWMAKDECGNASFCHQRITVRDTTPPVLFLPADVTLEYPADTSTNATGTATGSDTCGAVTVTYADAVTEGCGGTATIVRKWTAVDECGNSTDGSQTITLQDTTAPKVACRNIKVECSGDVPPASADLAAFLAAGGTATDNSTTPLTLSLESDSGLVGSCPGTVTRVYRVTDDCGNFTDCTQTITVDDTIAPMLTCPAGVTVECGDSLDPALLGSATAFDNCSTNVLITYTDAQVPSQYNIKWYAADPSPGTGPYSPTYLKLGPGSLDCPSAAHLTGRAIDPLRNAVAYASPAGQLDALTSLGGEPMAFGQIVPFEAVIQVGGGPGPEHGTIEFTSSWSTHTTSNDRLGYDTNYMVYCAFVDAADPGTLDPRFNAKVESYSAKLVNAGTINEKILGTFRISGLDSGDRVIVEIWVVLASDVPDHFGGTIASDLVSAQTASDPPAPITVGSQTVSIGNLSKITALPPAQPQPPEPSLPPQPPVPPGVMVSLIDRTWAATDDCGNRNTCDQQIIVWDSTPPVITLPASLTLECGDPTDPDSTGWAQVEDGCGTAQVQYTDSATPLCGGSQVIERSWMATDEWGNSTSAVQTITVEDTTPPVFLPEPDLVVDAGEAWVVETPVAEDSCSAVSVHLESTVTNTLPDGSYTIEYTWEAEDACGNTASMNNTIEVLGVALPNPKLAIAPRDGWLLVSWPAVPSGWWLESTVSLADPRWKPVTISPVVTNDLCVVKVAPTGPSQWFRLATGEPPLALSQVQPGRLLLTWPSLAAGYSVERCDDLSTGIWTPDPTTILVTNGLHCLEFDATGNSAFFRLVKPNP